MRQPIRNWKRNKNEEARTERVRGGALALRVAARDGLLARLLVGRVGGLELVRALVRLDRARPVALQLHRTTATRAFLLQHSTRVYSPLAFLRLHLIDNRH